MLMQHDGFDHYGSFTLNTTSAGAIQMISDGYVQATGACSTGTAYGKVSGSLGVGLTASTTDLIWLKKPVKPEGAIATGVAYTPQKRVFHGFAVRFVVAPTGNLYFATIGGVKVSIGSDWYVYVDGVNTQYQCELNIWNFVELKVDIENSKFQLWMTETMVYEKSWTPVALDFWEIRCQYTTGSGTQLIMHVDDHHLLDANPVAFDGRATTNVDRIGKSSTLTRFPTADDTKGMTPNSGTTNYTQVNQSTADGDTTFVSGSVAGAQDYYTNLTAIPTVDDNAIRAITISPNVRMLEPDSLGVSAVVKVGTSEAVGYRMKLKAAQYSSQKIVFESSPATNAPWTPTEAVNVKFGQRILAKP